MELHLFGPQATPALGKALQDAIEAVDDALTIHRPSPTTALNDQLRRDGEAVIADPILWDALLACIAYHRKTGGLFDPAFGPESPGLAHLAVDHAAMQVEAARALAFDFGGLGKGIALDRCRPVLAAAGAECALLSLGDSSVLAWGGHPLGGDWPIAVPDPVDAASSLVAYDLKSCCLSISSSLGAVQGATLRPASGTAIFRPRTAVACHPSGARAEAFSTAMLAADRDERAGLIAALEVGSVAVFDHSSGVAAAEPPHLAEARA